MAVFTIEFLFDFLRIFVFSKLENTMQTFQNQSDELDDKFS